MKIEVSYYLVIIQYDYINKLKEFYLFIYKKINNQYNQNKRKTEFQLEKYKIENAKKYNLNNDDNIYKLNNISLDCFTNIIK